jgi:hypothetical protein
LGGLGTTPPDEIVYFDAVKDSDGNIHTVFTVHQGPEEFHSDYQIFYQKFTSKGKPLNDRFQIKSYSFDNRIEEVSTPYHIVIYNNTVAIFRYRFGSEEENIYYIYSEDGGKSWSKKYTVETDGNSPTRFNVESGRGGIHVLYEVGYLYSRSDNPDEAGEHLIMPDYDVYFTTLMEFPSKWSEPIAIAPVDNIDSTNSRLEIVNDTLVVSWDDEGENIPPYIKHWWDTYCRLSNDDGRTWSESVKINEVRGSVYSSVFWKDGFYYVFYPNHVDTIDRLQSRKVNETGSVRTDKAFEIDDGDYKGDYKILEETFQDSYYVIYLRDESFHEPGVYDEKYRLKMYVQPEDDSVHKRIELAESSGFGRVVLINEPVGHPSIMYIKETEISGQWNRKEIEYISLDSEGKIKNRIQFISTGDTIIPKNIPINAILIAVYVPLFTGLLLSMNAYFGNSMYDTTPPEHKLLKFSLKNKKRIFLTLRIIMVSSIFLLIVLVYLGPYIGLIMLWTSIYILPMLILIEFSLIIEDFVHTSWRLRTWRLFHNISIIMGILFFLLIMGNLLFYYYLPFLFVIFIYSLPVLSVILIIYLSKVRKFTSYPFIYPPAKNIHNRIMLKNLELAIVLVLSLMAGCAMTALMFSGT